MAASRTRTSSPAGAVDAHLELGLGHRQLAQVRARRPWPDRGAAARRAARTCASAAALAAQRRDALRVEIGRPLIVGRQVGQAALGLGRVGDDVVERRPVFAAHVAQQLAAGPQRREPLGIFFDALGDGPDVVGDVVEVGVHRSQPAGERRDRARGRPWRRAR